MVTHKSIEELIKAWKARYLKANRKEKTKILGELVALTGYHRKAAEPGVDHSTLSGKALITARKENCLTTKLICRYGAQRIGGQVERLVRRSNSFDIHCLFLSENH